MARKARIHVPGGLYHVMLRGNAGEDIFFSKEDRYHFYLLLQEGISRFGYRVHGFCLMRNHIHLVLQVGKVPLSKILQNLSFRYTRWFNQKKKRIGHLFQGRYKALLVDADQYLLQLIRYIHLNPVRAKIVKRPEEYPWSGHKAYLGRQKLPWLSTEWVLGQLGKRKLKAVEKYQEYVREGVQEGHREDFHRGKEDVRVLGDDKFVEEALGEEVEDKSKRMTLKEIVVKVCREYCIGERELEKVSRNRKASEARSVIGYLCVQTGSATLTEVGKRFKRDVATISKGVRRVEQGVEESKEIKAKLLNLIKAK